MDWDRLDRTELDWCRRKLGVVWVLSASLGMYQFEMEEFICVLSSYSYYCFYYYYLYAKLSYLVP